MVFNPNDNAFHTKPVNRRPQARRKHMHKAGKWELVKEEVYQVYIVDNHTLAETMDFIQQKHRFTASERTWKSKIKGWGFDKNVSSTDMAIIVAKAKKRAREDGKDTIFFHHGYQVEAEKIERFKRRKISKEVFASPSAPTPCSLTYCTPGPDDNELDPEVMPWHGFDSLSLSNDPELATHDKEERAPQIELFASRTDLPALVSQAGESEGSQNSSPSQNSPDLARIWLAAKQQYVIVDAQFATPELMDMGWQGMRREISHEGCCSPTPDTPGSGLSNWPSQSILTILVDNHSSGTSTTSNQITYLDTQLKDTENSMAFGLNSPISHSTQTELNTARLGQLVTSYMQEGLLVDAVSACALLLGYDHCSAFSMRRTASYAYILVSILESRLEHEMAEKPYRHAARIYEMLDTEDKLSYQGQVEFFKCESSVVRILQKTHHSSEARLFVLEAIGKTILGSYWTKQERFNQLLDALSDLNDELASAEFAKTLNEKISKLRYSNDSAWESLHPRLVSNEAHIIFIEIAAGYSEFENFSEAETIFKVVESISEWRSPLAKAWLYYERGLHYARMDRLLEFLKDVILHFRSLMLYHIHDNGLPLPKWDAFSRLLDEAKSRIELCEDFAEAHSIALKDAQEEFDKHMRTSSGKDDLQINNRDIIYRRRRKYPQGPHPLEDAPESASDQWPLVRTRSLTSESASLSDCSTSYKYGITYSVSSIIGISDSEFMVD